MVTTFPIFGTLWVSNFGTENAQPVIESWTAQQIPGDVDLLDPGF